MDNSIKRMTLGGALIGGFLGAAAVFFGNSNRVSGFCQDTGFLGTHLLNSMFYGMGSDLLALWIVALIWFVYGALALGLVGFILGRILASAARRKQSAKY